MTELAGFHHIALTVRDLDASASWYRRVLDLEELFREEGERRRSIVFSFAAGETAAVGLVWHRDADGSFDPMNTGLDHVSFLVRRREDLDAWARRLDEEGVDHSGVIDVPPGAILNFKDPDGIALAIFWDR